MPKRDRNHCTCAACGGRPPFVGGVLLALLIPPAVAVAAFLSHLLGAF